MLRSLAVCAFAVLAAPASAAAQPLFPHARFPQPLVAQTAGDYPETLSLGGDDAFAWRVGRARPGATAAPVIAEGLRRVRTGGSAGSRPTSSSRGTARRRPPPTPPSRRRSSTSRARSGCTSGCAEADQAGRLG